MLLYYHSWMFYHHFITTLYHFLGLTYWHSAKVPVAVFACFLLRRKSVPNGDKMLWRFLWIFYGPEETRWAKEHQKRGPRVASTHMGALEAPWRALVGAGLLRHPSIDYHSYKFPENPKTLGESTKHNSSRRKFQNREIQSKHHHGGVHLPHRCLSDDA